MGASDDRVTEMVQVWGNFFHLTSSNSIPVNPLSVFVGTVCSVVVAPWSMLILRHLLIYVRDVPSTGVGLLAFTP